MDVLLLSNTDFPKTTLVIFFLSFFLMLTVKVPVVIFFVCFMFLFGRLLGKDLSIHRVCGVERERERRNLDQ